MAKAGHTDMKITRRYLHLAGIVFREEAAALERRLLGPQTGEAVAPAAWKVFTLKSSQQASRPQVRVSALFPAEEVALLRLQPREPFRRK